MRDQLNDPINYKLKGRQILLLVSQSNTLIQVLNCITDPVAVRSTSALPKWEKKAYPLVPLTSYTRDITPEGHYQQDWSKATNNVCQKATEAEVESSFGFVWISYGRASATVRSRDWLHLKCEDIWVLVMHWGDMSLHIMQRLGFICLCLSLDAYQHLHLPTAVPREHIPCR